MADADTAQFSLDELKALRRDRKGRTRSDAPEREVEASFWDSAQVVIPTQKASVHLRVDADVLAWFRGQGRGLLSRMNAVLRSYMESQTRKDL